MKIQNVVVTAKRGASCPCCGDPMSADLVVCWLCYRWSDSLTPGTYVDKSSSVPTDSEITRDDIRRWEDLRTARLTAAGTA